MYNLVYVYVANVNMKILNRFIINYYWLGFIDYVNIFIGLH